MPALGKLAPSTFRLMNFRASTALLQAGMLQRCAPTVWKQHNFRPGLSLAGGNWKRLRSCVILGTVELPAVADIPQAGPSRHPIRKGTELPTQPVPCLETFA